MTRLELKDEVRKDEKVLKGKTRAYFVAPVEFQILTRLAFINITQGIIAAGIRAGHAVGLNPMTDWGVLAQKLLAKENILVIDFEGYDGSVFP